MRRILSILAAAGAALALCLVPVGPASAFGGETLDCAVGPGALSHGVCSPHQIASPVGISFLVGNLSGSGYSFSWTLSGRATITQGCTSTTDYCWLTSGTASDHEVTASVTVAQNGSSETLSATAQVFAVCGKFWC